MAQVALIHVSMHIHMGKESYSRLGSRVVHKNSIKRLRLSLLSFLRLPKETRACIKRSLRQFGPVSKSQYFAREGRQAIFHLRFDLPRIRQSKYQSPTPVNIGLIFSSGPTQRQPGVGGAAVDKERDKSL